MRGLKQFSVSFCFFFLVSNVHSYVPKVGQVLRFQPQILRGQKPFKSKGHLIRGDGSKVAYEIQWQGQGDYTVFVNSVPKSFYFSEPEKNPSWILRRNPKAGCLLVSEGVSYKCGDANFWAFSELSGMPDTTVKSYQTHGFIGSNEVAFEETDGRSLGALPSFERSGQAQPPTLITATAVSQSTRIQPAIGFNGQKPIAVLEIKGDNFTTPQNNTVEGYPLLHFDPTFLVPVLARWKFDGALYTIKAISDVDIKRKRPRFTHVLASRVEVFEGTNFLGAFERGESDFNFKPSNSAVTQSKIQIDVSNFKSILSKEGQNFFTALTLIH